MFALFLLLFVAVSVCSSFVHRHTTYKYIYVPALYLFFIVICLALKHTQEDSLQQSDVCSETTLDQNCYLNA